MSWLGPIPASWQLLPLRAVLSARGEYNRGPKTKNVLSLLKDRGVVPYSQRGVGGNKKSDNIEQYKIICPGDIVMNRMNAIFGSVGLSQHYGAASIEYYVLRPTNSSVCNRYYGHIFCSKTFQSSLVGIGKGILHHRMRIPYVRLKSLMMPVPPPATQKAIADFLDRKTAAIDALIEKKQKLLELLAEKRAALINQAVTKGLDPNVPMRDSGIPWIGEIPSHWRMMQLRRALKGIEQGWSPQCDARPVSGDQWGVLKAGCTAGGVFRSSEHKALPTDLEPRPGLQVRRGDLIVSRASGSPDIVGSAAVVGPLHHRLLLSDKLFRLRLDDAVALPVFLSLALSSRSARSQIENAISGAQGLANNLPQARLKEVVVACPPVEEQRAISATVERALASSASFASCLVASVERLQEYRQALITAAVTGQLDIDDEETT